MPSAVLAKSRLDAILVIDNSASMLTTDPSNHRIDAIRLFVSLLGEDDRVALIGFDQSAQLLSDFQPVTAASRRQFESLLQKLAFPTGSYTNLRDPFLKVDELAQSLREGADPLVILLTDGHMDVGDAREDERLKSVLRDADLPRLVNRKIRLYGLAFTAESDIQLLKQLANASGGFARAVVDPRDLTTVFSDIFQSIKQADSLPISNGRFTVDAAVGELAFVAKPLQGQTLSLRAPDGQVHRPDSSAGAPLDLIRVASPAPGVWSAESEVVEPRAFADTDLSLDARLVKPAGGGQGTLEFWLSRRGQRQRMDEAADPPRIDVDLSSSKDSANGKPLAKTLTVRPLADGGYQSPLPLVPVGAYEIRIRLITKTFQRERRIGWQAVVAVHPVTNARLPAVVHDSAARTDASTAPAATHQQLVDGAIRLAWVNLLIFGLGCAAFCVRFMRKLQKSDRP
jgi:hypothetical protein